MARTSPARPTSPKTAVPARTGRLRTLDTTDSRVAFLHTVTLLALTYLGLVLGGRKGEWLEPARLISLFRATAPKKARHEP